MNIKELEKVLADVNVESLQEIPMTDIQRRRITLFKEGLSPSEISKIEHVGGSTIHASLESAMVKVRKSLK